MEELNKEEIRKLKEKVDMLENQLNKKDKLIDTLIDNQNNTMKREQDKNEVTVRTIKEITKQNAIKEFAIVVSILIFLLIYYSL